MAQPASSPKIEELRFRLKTDPKSRLFFPLAEELRKIDQFGEAEQVLRAGLAQHPTYLSAWVSLGRVLREANKQQDAVEALMKALTLDPGNVVAARLLADSYLDLGERLEAIKKYKLVRALLPTDDEELEAMIAKLDQELNAPAHPPAPFMADAEPAPLPETDMLPASGDNQVFGETPAGDTTADGEPMLAAHSESPFEEPVADYSAAAVTIEKPVGMHIEAPPLSAETPTPWTDTKPDVADTATMADLYAKQGAHDKAREIYESILQREPGNADVKSKLESLGGAGRNPKVEKLEQWLAKVKKREQGSVV
jgi:tetratricopeptide (TPR) repeat protein